MAKAKKKTSSEAEITFPNEAVEETRSQKEQDYEALQVAMYGDKKEQVVIFAPSPPEQEMMAQAAQERVDEIIANNPITEAFEKAYAEKEDCLHPECDRKVQAKKLFCTAHYYKIPYDLRTALSRGDNVQAAVMEHFKKKAPKTVVPAFEVSGEAPIELSLNQAKALMVIGTGADIYNYSVSLDLRKMEANIPRCKRYFSIVKSQGHSNDPRVKQPFFAAEVTDLGLELAEKRLKDVNPLEIQMADIVPYSKHV